MSDANPDLGWGLDITPSGNFVQFSFPSIDAMIYFYYLNAGAVFGGTSFCLR